MSAPVAAAFSATAIGADFMDYGLPSRMVGRSGRTSVSRIPTYRQFVEVCRVPSNPDTIRRLLVVIEDAFDVVESRVVVPQPVDA